MNFLKQWWPTIVTLGGTLIGMFTPSIQGYLLKHPELMTGIAGIYAILQHLLPSPVVKPAISIPAQK